MVPPEPPWMQPARWPSGLGAALGPALQLLSRLGGPGHWPRSPARWPAAAEGDRAGGPCAQGGGRQLLSPGPVQQFLLQTSGQGAPQPAPAVTSNGAQSSPYYSVWGLGEGVLGDRGSVFPAGGQWRKGLALPTGIP